MHLKSGLMRLVHIFLVSNFQNGKVIAKTMKGGETMDNNTKDLTQSKEIAEHVCRSLASAVYLPEFSIGSVPVSVVAKVMGKDATWVQAGIISGWLPIGKPLRRSN